MLFLVGTLLEGAALALEFSDALHPLYRVIAPTYWHVSAAYNKLAQPGYVLPTDNGYKELSKILCSLPEVVEWAGSGSHTNGGVLKNNLRLEIAAQDPVFRRAGVAFYDNVIDFKISCTSRKDLFIGQCPKTWLKDTISDTKTLWITVWAFLLFVIGAALEFFTLIFELSQKEGEPTSNLDQFSDSEPSSY